MLTGLVLISGSSQDAQTQPQLSVVALRQDFTIFRRALEEVHPGLYEHTKKPDLDAEFDAVYNTLIHPLTELEFYRRLSPIITTIHCYHTGLQLSTLSLERFDDTQRVVPLDIKVLEGRPYVFRNFGAAQVPLGSEILAINGVPANTIIARLVGNAVLPTDGFGLPGRYRKLSRPLSFSRQLACKSQRRKRSRYR
jgi:hypothetical protein